MNFTKRFSTFLFKFRLFSIHLSHILLGRKADASYGSKCSSWTANPFTHHMGGIIRLGNQVKLGRAIDINVRKGAEFTVGDYVRITGTTYLCCSQKITIGNHVLIAEFCTIRDQDHGIEPGEYIDKQCGAAMPISIGNDVWIGAGCAILKGAVIPDGCVIGAHSLVLRNSKLVPNGIYAGSPVRLIRMR